MLDVKFLRHPRKNRAADRLAKFVIIFNFNQSYIDTQRADAEQHIQYGAAREETAYPANDDAKEQAVMELFASLIEKEQTEQIIQALKDPGYLEALLKGCAE
ncbi:MAG: hypothetical protein IJJ75_03225 [Firmicutes bacterium]|nr:hypothetical protein [Bacillota bacterium]